MANLLSGILDKFDSFAKDTLSGHEEESATAIRLRRKAGAVGKTADDEALSSQILETAPELEEHSKQTLDDTLAPPVTEMHTTPSLAPNSASFQTSPGPIPTPIAPAPKSDPGSDLSNPPTKVAARTKAVVNSSTDPWKVVERQRKEIEDVNRECLELEERCKSLQEEVADAWKTFKSSQEKAALREGELRDEIAALKRSKDSEMVQLAGAMEDQNKETTELHERLKELILEDQRLRVCVQSLEAELASVRKDKDDILNELIDFRSSQALSVESVREELRKAEEQTVELQRQHANWLKNSQKREMELEQTNANLSASLASQMRKYEELQRQLKQAPGQDITKNETYTSLARDLADAQNALEVASQHKQALSVQVRTLEQELQTRKDLWEEERRALFSDADGLRAKVASLTKALEELQTSTQNRTHDRRLAELETKNSQLTEQLLRKQSQLHNLQTEKTALKSRAQDLESRLQQTEQQLETLRDVEGDGYEVMSHTQTQGGAALRRRTGQTARMFGTALEPIGVNPHVVKAVDVIDGLSLVAGSFMRANPIARFAFVVYLCVLHIWVFVVLGMHTHSLDTIEEPVISSGPNGNTVAFT